MKNKGIDLTGKEVSNYFKEAVKILKRQKKEYRDMINKYYKDIELMYTKELKKLENDKNS